MSLQQALRNNNWKDTSFLLKEIKKEIQQLSSNVTLLWVPSHCFIEGNEKADELAKQGSKLIKDGVPVSSAIAKPRIRRQKWDTPHQRAQNAYLERRHPRIEIKKA